MHEVESLSDETLEYVARLLRSLKSRPNEAPLPSYDPAVYGPLYREFADESRKLAEEDMADYATQIDAEEV